MFRLKTDFKKTKQRFDAFWQGGIIDRAPVSLTIPIENPKQLPQKNHSNHKMRWLDIDYRVEYEITKLNNNKYLGDALPIIVPNMGPEIFSAWCGCGYEYGETTTWSTPCINNWETDMDKACLNMNHPLLLKTEEYTRKLIEHGKGEFITGLTDFHPGGDHLAALRDPQYLAIDMIENLDFIKSKLESSQKEFFKAYNYFYDILKSENLPVTSWIPIINDKSFYIPSNDFSCMISKKMFDDVFLDGIINECRFYDKSIYHLDGPDALHHLDSLLDIKELDGVQWVPGAGNEGYAKWIDVYQKIQNQGKLIQLWVDIDELSLVFETLKPEGVWISGICGISDEYSANEVLKRISKWE